MVKWCLYNTDPSEYDVLQVVHVDDPAILVHVFRPLCRIQRHAPHYLWSAGKLGLKINISWKGYKIQNNDCKKINDVVGIFDR